jgi:hypothetical protein
MNRPPVRRRLRTQIARYNQLCSSLETLRQTEAAVEAFARFEGEIGSGGHFLALYGVLQALVLQQDAVCHLQEALGDVSKSVISNRQLQDVRTIRNWSVGHPTKVDRRDTLSHHKIRRPRLGRGFELVSAFDDGTHQYRYVSIADLVRTQKLALGRLLRKMLLVLHQIDLTKHVEIERRNSYSSPHKKQVVKKLAHPHLHHPKPLAKSEQQRSHPSAIAKPAKTDRRKGDRRSLQRLHTSDRRKRTPQAGKVIPGGKITIVQPSQRRAMSVRSSEPKVGRAYPLRAHRKAS